MDTQNNGAKGGSFVEKYATPLALLAAAVIIGGALVFGRGAEKPTPTPGDEPVAVDIKKVKTETSPYVGEKNAPVTMAVWFDYQCRFCKQFETTTLAELQSYVKEGKLRIVYKDFQFLGPASDQAALYSRAVWEAHPDRWHEWFSALFADGAESTANVDGMNAISTRLGLDVAKIGKLMTDKRADYQKAIAADRSEGQSFGINGTPGTIIGTTFFSGAVPAAQIIPLIEG